MEQNFVTVTLYVYVDFRDLKIGRYNSVRVLLAISCREIWVFLEKLQWQRLLVVVAVRPRLHGNDMAETVIRTSD